MSILPDKLAAAVVDRDRGSATPAATTPPFFRAAHAWPDILLSILSWRPVSLLSFAAKPRPDRSLWSAVSLASVFLRSLCRRLRLSPRSLHECFAIFVMIFFGIPFRAHAVDQRFGHVHLTFAALHLFWNMQLFRVREAAEDSRHYTLSILGRDLEFRARNSAEFKQANERLFNQIVRTGCAGGDADNGAAVWQPISRDDFALLMQIVMLDLVAREQA